MKHFINTMFVLLAFVASLGAVKAQDARSLPAPSSDKAQIVFLKPMGGPWSGGGTGIFELKDGNRTLMGVLPGNSKLVLEVSPGEHRFMSFTVKFAHFLDAKVEAGKRYYVLARFIYGSGFQLRPIRRAGSSDYNATTPDFRQWLSDTEIAKPSEKRAKWFERDKEYIDKAQVTAQKSWDRHTAEEHAELMLTPDDSLE